jgi:acyl-CoA synthetase (NDP forming)
MTPDKSGSAQHPIARMLTPRSVAVIGVSPKPGSPGATLVDQLKLNNFTGPIHVVGRSGGELDGLPIATTVDSLPEGIDLALVMLPAGAVKEAVLGLVARRAHVAVIFASGFAEFGDAGRAEQDEIATIAHNGGLHLVGPNCVGYTNFVDPLNIIFMRDAPVPQLEPKDPPALAVIAQSGGLMGLIFQGLQTRGVPVAYRISTGNEASLSLADFLDYFADDPTTSGIVIYAEDIRDPHAFLGAAAKARERGKSVVVMHAGRGTKAQIAAASHTGALAGDYEVMKTLVRRAGVCMVESLEELVDVAEILARYPQPPTAGPAVATSSGAFCSIALDALDDAVIDVPDLSPDIEDTLQNRLPAYMKAGNPLDLGTLIMSDTDLYYDSVSSLVSDDQIGSVVLAVPNAHPGINQIMLEKVTRAAAHQDKPVIIGLLSDDLPVSAEFSSYARDRGMIVSKSPERSLRAIASATHYGRSLATPRTVSSHFEIGDLPPLGVGPQPEWIGKKFLGALGVPVPDGTLVTSLDDAVTAANSIGYPVVAKAQAASLSHKTEAGAVILDIADEPSLRAAWTTLTEAAQRAGVLDLDGVLIEKMASPGIELVVGAKRDPAWGPVVLVGLGGIWTEAIGDVRLLAPDLPDDEIVAEIAQLRCAKLFGEFRGSAATDLFAIARVVSTLGHLMMARDDIVEVDINPLVARADAVTALDALIITTDGSSNGALADTHERAGAARV